MTKAYLALDRLPEDEQIRIIAQAAGSGYVCGVVVDNDAKADRYVHKLSAYPVRIVSRGSGPVKGTIMLRVGPKES
jgi:hypothetical protein